MNQITTDIFLHISKRFKIDNAKIPEAQYRSAIIRLLRELDSNYVTKILSKDIANFIYNIDTSNPLIVDLLDGDLVSPDPSSLNIVLQLYVSLMDQVKKNPYFNDNLIKSLKAHPKWKHFKNINILEKCRFINSKSLRHDLRRKDHDNNICLDSFCKKSNIYLEDVKTPEKYYPFTKIEIPTNPEHIKKLDLFSKNQLFNLKAAIQQEIDLEKKGDKDKSVYDFKKIGINNAIALLAKMNGYEFSHSHGCFTKNSKGLTPVLINATKYIEYITETCRITMEMCDSWADNKQKPIFDYYKILTIGQANSLKADFAVTNTGLLLGQKDHNLYFINYTI